MALDDDRYRLDRIYVRRLTRRDVLRRGAGGAGALAFAAFLAACGEDGNGGGGGGGGLSEVPTDGSTVDMDALIASAQNEGTLNTIALPPDWANYGEIMDTFGTEYSMEVVNASPNASSEEELVAVRTLEGQDRAPDVLDVGPPFALSGAEEGLFAPYFVSTWDTIPENLKDPDGLWVGDYWGVTAFGANTDVVDNVPTSFESLLDPQYRSQVAMNGDPRESGSAFAGVFAASLANGGSLDDITPGIDFFAELADAGNFIAVDATPASVARGETPITIDWDYLQIAYGDEFAGQITWEVSVPSDGVFGNHYCQAINVGAPHPFAARLWQEFLYSDQGQLLWLEGYSHPARFQEMSDRGVIPQELLDKLPPADAYELVVFPNAEQTEAASAIIQEQWGQRVTGV
jgi:putative spermidine/putrescine transport system substrate-binding protein